MIRFLFAAVVLYFLFQVTVGDLFRDAMAANTCPVPTPTTVVTR
jgi:hypothetical protein